jgi:hypothetical protein
METQPDDDTDNEAEESDATHLSEVHARAMERFSDFKCQVEIRAESLQARRFVSIPGAQWEGEWGLQFENGIRVEVNKTARGLEKIETDYRANRLTVDYRAVSNDANDHTASTLDGVHRADAYHFKSQQARDNAFQEAVSGGFGAYRLTTDYADPYDKDSDEQRVNPGMVIVDADQSVFMDLNSKLYDKSDAKFGYVLTAMTRQAFTAEYGAHRAADWPSNLIKPWYDWYTPDIVRIAEYYEVEDTDEKLWIFTNPVSDASQRWFDSEIEAQARTDLVTQGWKQSSRKVKRRRVHKYVMSGAEILEDNGYIAGSCLPIVCVYGKRWFIDNMERWRGHVQLAMDSQRIYNAEVSKLVETSSLAPREVPIVTPGQIAGHESAWADQNRNRSPYLLLNPTVDANGNEIPTPPIGSIKPPDVPQVTAALLQIASNDLTEVTNSEDGADEVVSNTSHAAMDLAATRTDAKSGIYMDNMRQSVQREGEIYLDMAKEVYFEPGRKVETLGEDGEEGTEVLHEGFTDETGLYMIRNDLQRGKYKVISDVTEATSTRRDKTVNQMLNVAQVATAGQDMELASAALSVAVQQMDGEGLDELQAWNRQRMLKIGLAKPTPEEQAQMEQAQNADQQPDPAQTALLAQAAELAASADLKKAQAAKAEADTQQSKAKTVLTLAQATAVGGPESAPSGMRPAESPLDQAKKIAEIHHVARKTTAIDDAHRIAAHDAQTRRIAAERPAGTA